MIAGSSGWRSDTGPMALAVALGLGIGWLDLHTTEVVVTASALLLAGLALGYLRPRAAWRWAVPLALGLPAMAIVGHLFHSADSRADPRGSAHRPGRLGVRIGGLLRRRHGPPGRRAAPDLGMSERTSTRIARRGDGS